MSRKNRVANSDANIMCSLTVPMPFIQRAVGHRNMQTTTDNYIRLRQDGLRNSVNVFNKLNEPKPSEESDTIGEKTVYNSTPSFKGPPPLLDCALEPFSGLSDSLNEEQV